MDFLKKHYEKIILGIVLIGMVAALLYIPFKVASERRELDEKKSSLIQRSVKPLTNLDLTIAQASLKREATPVVLDFASNHRLFNPMPWQKAANGQPIKFDDSHIGPKAVTITKLTPLYLIITLDNVNMSDSGARYVVGVEKQAAPNPTHRTKKETYCKLNDKNDVFALRKVEGPPDKPTKLTLELNDTGEAAVIGPDQAYKRIDGYTADLKYGPENMTWSNRRVGSPLRFNGEEFNIVAISQNEVVLSAKSNQKKWPIPYNPTSSNTPNAALNN